MGSTTFKTLIMKKKKVIGLSVSLKIIAAAASPTEN